MFFGDADKVLVVKTVVREVMTGLMLVLVVILQRALQEAMQVPSFQRWSPPVFHDQDVVPVLFVLFHALSHERIVD